MYNRIAGIPPNAAQLAQMLAAGSPISRGADRDQRPQVLQRHHPQHGGALDQQGSVGVRAVERLHRDRDRHGSGQQAVQHHPQRRHHLHRRRPVGRGQLLAGQQRHVSGARRQQRRSQQALEVQHAVHGDRHPLGGDRRRDHHPRCGERVLRERHEPRDVPLHHDQSSLQRPAHGDGHHPAARPDPPGRDPQPRRRQHPVPDQLHRLPLGDGPDGAGVRVLQLLVSGERDRRDGLADRPDRLHRRPDAAEVPHQHHQFPARVHHPG